MAIKERARRQKRSAGDLLSELARGALPRRHLERPEDQEAEESPGGRVLMIDEIPLWEKEDLQREFKARLALDNPDIIAREAVGMLNVSGGTVWVGLRDDKEGRAVEVQPIPEAEGERRRLLDFLVDAIEPSPTGEELEVRVVSREGGDLLAVTLRPSEGRKPYALLKKGGRHFVTRVGDRIRPMGREEISASFRESSGIGGDLNGAEEALRWEIQRLLERQPAPEIFWLGIRPVPQLSLDLDQVEASDLLIDPALTGNRRAGSTFLAARVWGPARARAAGTASYLTVGKPELSELAVYPDGSLHFTVPLKSLHAGNEPELPGPFIPRPWPSIRPPSSGWPPSSTGNLLCGREIGCRRLTRPWSSGSLYWVCGAGRYGRVLHVAEAPSAS